MKKSKPASLPKNIANTGVSRRRFIAAAGAALALPTFIPGRALGLDGETAPI